MFAFFITTGGLGCVVIIVAVVCCRGLFFWCVFISNCSVVARAHLPRSHTKRNLPPPPLPSPLTHVQRGAEDTARVCADDCDVVHMGGAHVQDSCPHPLHWVGDLPRTNHQEQRAAAGLDGPALRGTARHRCPRQARTCRRRTVAAPPWSGPYKAPRCVQFVVLGLPVLPAARGAATRALARSHVPPPPPLPRQPNPPSTATGGISFLRGSGSAAACTRRPITTQRTATRRDTRRRAPCASGEPTPCASGAENVCARACARATGALQCGIGTSS